MHILPPLPFLALLFRAGLVSKTGIFDRLLLTHDVFIIHMLPCLGRARVPQQDGESGHRGPPGDV